MSEPKPPGKVATFYSYKGGSGRSLSLANVAWILASNGYRVLMVDWDLEAPGLHRYFAPFMSDAELETSLGLIDLLWDFTESAYEQTSLADPGWFSPQASFHNVSRYIASLRTNGEIGRLDLLPAGKQGPSYGTRVTGFDWDTFYEKLGGGLFLDAVSGELRKQYDFVLIDSRTGVSDTSGICTIQLPDALVVFFTLNRQSILGAAAATASSVSQRPKDRPLPVYAVPSRIEDGESDRRQAMLRLAFQYFAPFLKHLKDGLAPYWGRAQLKYKIRHAYEEQLATLVDDPEENGTVLQTCEYLSSQLAGRPGLRVKSISESFRRDVLQTFLSAATASNDVAMTMVAEATEAEKTNASSRTAAYTVVRRGAMLTAYAAAILMPILAYVAVQRNKSLDAAVAAAAAADLSLAKARGQLESTNKEIEDLRRALQKREPPPLCPNQQVTKLLQEKNDELLKNARLAEKRQSDAVAACQKTQDQYLTILKRNQTQLDACLASK